MCTDWYLCPESVSTLRSSLCLFCHFVSCVLYFVSPCQSDESNLLKLILVYSYIVLIQQFHRLGNGWALRNMFIAATHMTKIFKVDTTMKHMLIAATNMINMIIVAIIMTNILMPVTFCLCISQVGSLYLSGSNKLLFTICFRLAFFSSINQCLFSFWIVCCGLFNSLTCKSICSLLKDISIHTTCIFFPFVRQEWQVLAKMIQLPHIIIVLYLEKL